MRLLWSHNGDAVVIAIGDRRDAERPGRYDDSARDRSLRCRTRDAYVLQRGGRRAGMHEVDSPIFFYFDEPPPAFRAGERRHPRDPPSRIFP